MNAVTRRKPTTTLSQEINNRFAALPADQKRDVALALVRCAVEVTRDMMRDDPDAVEAFVRSYRRTH
jgi:hypothetical protein